MVNELINQNLYKIRQIYAEESWIEQHLTNVKDPSIVQQVSTKEIGRLSGLRSARSVIALVEMPIYTRPQIANKSLNLVLDHIQDPGNLGTIIRLADWFGIQHIFCSSDCVDMYNSKVIQASMGSFLRVQVQYVNLIDFLTDLEDVSIWATTLDGERINDLTIDATTYIIIGNEGNGIRDEILSKADKYISIDKIGEAESLNAAVATGIICYALS